MWSEEMDKKIRGAADNDMPAYDDKTWLGMEALLNKHLPQKRKRRGIIFFVLLGLLVAIPGIYMLAKFSGNNQISAVQKQQPVNPASHAQVNQNNQPSAATTGNNNSDQPKTDNLPAGNNTVVVPSENNTNQPGAATPVITSHPGNTAVIDVQVSNAGIATMNNKPGATKTGISKNIQAGSKNKKADFLAITTSAPAISGNKKTDAAISVNPSSAPGDIVTADKDKVAVSTSIAKELDKDTATEMAITEKTVAAQKIDSASTVIATPAQQKKKQTGKKSADKFSINFSIGSDITSVGLDRLGKVKGVYGVGVGYEINKRFSIRAGVYAGRKIYSADSTNYHNVYDWWGGSTYYKLDNVDANCLVYEVPVTVSYSFTAAKKYNWLVSTGLSSYFMKKEDYVYTYKDFSSTTSTKNLNYYNENRHILAVFNLSGGYQYHFNKRFSLLAEPYLKIPLTGIGAGSVRLNSAGVLLSAVIKPFAKK